MSKPDKYIKDLTALENKITDLTNDESGLDAFWARLDYNGNNIVSLAELDKLVACQYPLLNQKPALMRAYKKTTGKPALASTECSFIQRSELPALLKNLFVFNRLYHVFDKIDTDDDRRIDLTEFKRGFDLLGLDKTHKPDAVFKAVDANGGGIILFDEFCAWFEEHC
jgi:hypothetical protein